MNHEITKKKTEQGTDANKELQDIADRQKESITASMEVVDSTSNPEHEKLISAEAINGAESIDEKRQASQPRERSPAERRHSPSKQQREASFHSQMTHVQSNMSPSARIFSKFIHNKAIEKTTDILGATVARPNALLVSSLFAFIATTALYLVAKQYGYQLSGFETIGAAAIGWALGMIYDYFLLLSRRK